jgi:hypothetical protein
MAAALLTIMAEGRVKFSKAPMTKKNDSHRYVVPNSEWGGWDERACAHRSTEAEAINRARQIIEGRCGGEIRITNKRGGFIGSDTVSGPRHRESPAKDHE